MGGDYFIDPYTSPVLSLLMRIGINRVMATRLMHQESMMEPEDLLSRYDEAISTACSLCAKKAPTGFLNTISGTSQESLKLACHQVRFLANTSRPLDLVSITQPVLQRMKIRRDKLKKHRNDNVTSPDFTDKSFRVEEVDKTWNKLREYLGKLRDDQGIPLLAFVRPSEKMIPKDSADDPSTNYPNHDAELIARVPMLRPGPVPQGTTEAVDEMISSNVLFQSEQFQAANSVLYTVLHSLLNERRVWAHAGPASRMLRGRTAFWNMHRGIFGANISTFRLKQLDAKVAKLSYKGEQKRFNFQMYTENHQEINNQRNIIIREGTGIQSDMVEWSGHTRVSKLLAGISSGVIDGPLAQISGDPTRRNNFQACIEYIQTWINDNPPQDDGGARNRNVSQVGSKKRGGATKNDGGRKKSKQEQVSQEEIDRQTHIVDKQYSPKEYAQLTKAEKAYLYQLRKNKTTDHARAVSEIKATTERLKEARQEFEDIGSGNRRGRSVSRSEGRSSRPSSFPPGPESRSRSRSHSDREMDEEGYGRRQRHRGGRGGRRSKN